MPSQDIQRKLSNKICNLHSLFADDGSATRLEAVVNAHLQELTSTPDAANLPEQVLVDRACQALTEIEQMKKTLDEAHAIINGNLYAVVALQGA